MKTFRTYQEEVYVIQTIKLLRSVVVDIDVVKEAGNYEAAGDLNSQVSYQLVVVRAEPITRRKGV